VTDSVPPIVIGSDQALAKKHTDWAIFNTRFASERTLMAALRTALSLISFGFTIYKFFESVHTTAGTSPLRVNGPRRLGITLVAIGIFVLVFGALQHWHYLKELRRETNLSFPFSISLVASVLLAITGIVVFVTILNRL
jgi:putative membrane protein